MRTATSVASAAAVVATATVGGLASRPASQSVWYRQLRKPAYQPARSAFPVVWPVLYAGIAAVSAATFDRLRDAGSAPAARSCLGAWVFFNRRHLAAAAAVNAALPASSADLARRAIAVRGSRAAWLCLYPAWCAFAFVLSTQIWMLNRHVRIDVP
ncbi:TspO/MBR family protein [Mycobacterium interjectum]|uniref:TspO/MBR family protein n=1 Tax=Mycobacterium interjectum TaxID=33895 RepID=UPI00082AA8DA|nr:TspO/MBR family protein [Mycobacterium interjectum]MCV7091224.1 tryptophan-rich sensory protein [Mycobacterium interjectum]